MTTLTLSAANVRPLPGCIIRRFTAGAAIDCGSPVYVSAADTILDTDDVSAAGAACIGVMVSAPSGAMAAAAGDECDVVLFGPVTGWTDITAGAYYYVGATAGEIDAAAGTKDALVGIGLNLTTLLVRPSGIDLT